MRLEPRAEGGLALRQRHIEAVELVSDPARVAGAAFPGEPGGDGVAGIEQQHEPPAGADCALQSFENVEAAIRRNEMQRAMHQHDVETPLDLQVAQVLPDRFDRQRPPCSEPAAELKRRFADIEDRDIGAMIGGGSRHQRKDAAIRRARDQHMVTAVRKQIGNPPFQWRRPSFDTGRRPGQPDVGPQRMQVAT